MGSLLTLSTRELESGSVKEISRKSEPVVFSLEAFDYSDGLLGGVLDVTLAMLSGLSTGREQRGALFDGAGVDAPHAKGQRLVCVVLTPVYDHPTVAEDVRGSMAVEGASGLLTGLCVVLSQLVVLLGCPHPGRYVTTIRAGGA
jgi:hypothetical protein